jgi:hypothetical protein
MGVDLAMHVERREGGVWVLADPAIWYEDEHYDEIEDAWWGPTEIYDHRCGRSRALMSLLGDGNLFGQGTLDLAGHSPALPGHPRGLPPDLSPPLRAHAQRRSDMAHWYSWALVRELLEIDWSAPYTYHHAYVRREHAHLFDGIRLPQGWPAERELFEAVQVSDEAALRRPEGVAFAEPWNGRELRWEQVGREYVRVRWMATSFAEQAGECFVTEILPLLESYGDPNQHRVVYWVW